MNAIELAENGNDFEQKLSELKSHYVEHLKLAVETVESLWASIIRDPDDASSISRLERAAHKLAGSGATFGFPLVSEAARALELIVQNLAEKKAEATQQEAKKITSLVESLKVACADVSLSLVSHSPDDSYTGTEREPTELVADDNQAESIQFQGRIPKILLVDDDPFILRAIELQLGAFRVDVLKAATGRLAYGVAYEQIPDLIITDYSMPDGAGDYLLSRLKQNVSTKNIPVVILTASKINRRTDEALRRELLGRHQASDYIEKPLKMKEILHVIRRHVTLRTKNAVTSGGEA